MPNRWIRESIQTSESIDQLSVHAERFFYRLLTLVDDFGRYDSRPSVIRGRAFPLKKNVSDKNVADWMEELIDAGMLQLYGAEGATTAQFFYFTNWSKYENIRAKTSKFPDPVVVFEHLQTHVNTCEHVQTHVPVLVPRTSSSISSSSSESESARPAARDPQTLDEEKAYEYAASKGYSRDETDNLLEDFRDHWQSKGWLDKGIPLKDVDARFRRWVRNEIKFGHLPAGPPPPSPEVDAAEERERQAREERLAREAAAERDFQERLEWTRKAKRDREERQRAAQVAS